MNISVKQPTLRKTLTFKRSLVGSEPASGNLGEFDTFRMICMDFLLIDAYCRHNFITNG